MGWGGGYRNPTGNLVHGMKRRTFVNSAAGLAVGGMALTPGCTAREASGAKSRALERFGLQLYTVRGLMAEDVERTLDLVASVGYREVEFAGYFGRAPAKVHEQLEATGLVAPSAHVALPDLRDRLEEVLEAAEVVGHRYLVLAWLAESDRRTLDDYRSIADEMNGFGVACRAAGVQFAYHNHDFEFEEMEGRIPYDVLLARCDAQLVRMELDLFWIRAGGQDPLDYFQRHPGRFPLCHVKDMTASGEMASVGDGTIDFAAIFARSREAGLEHYFVEHDNPPDPEQSIEVSARYLAGLTF